MTKQKPLQNGRRLPAHGYSDKPNVLKRLFALKNVTLLPHVVSATRETRQAMADLVLANLKAFFATGRVKVGVPLPEQA